MKILKFLLATALTFPLFSFSQSPGTVSAVSVALTLSYSRPGLVERDEEGVIVGYVDNQTINSAKMNPKTGETVSEQSVTTYSTKSGVLKYSNKEVLLDLLDMGELPGINGREPAISGWSIIHVTGGEQSESRSLSRVYIRHSSKVLHDISGMFQLTPEAEGTKAVAGNSIEKTTYTADGDSRTTNSQTYAESFKTVASFTMNELFSGRGILTGGTKLTFMSYWDENDELYKYPVYVPSAMKLGSITGVGSADIWIGDIYFESQVIIEGAFSVGAGKAYSDIDTFLNP